ncbi:hypothetical protein, partial [Mesorhizobium sp.]|uniref:hypothetical protein n=1 Tax=Mesorhizobium sp. TaxID=1871066 RepID=UPI0025DA8834
ALPEETMPPFRARVQKLPWPVGSGTLRGGQRELFHRQATLPHGGGLSTLQVASQNSNAADLIQLPCIVFLRCHFTDGIQAEVFDRFGRCHDEDTLCSIKGFKPQLESLSGSTFASKNQTHMPSP